MANSFHLSGRLTSNPKVIRLKSSYCAEIIIAVGVEIDSLKAVDLDFTDMFGTDDIENISSDITISIYSKDSNELTKLKKGKLVTVDGYHANKRYCKNKRWQTKVCLVAKNWRIEDNIEEF